MPHSMIARVECGVLFLFLLCTCRGFRLSSSSIQFNKKCQTRHVVSTRAARILVRESFKLQDTLADPFEPYKLWVQLRNTDRQGTYCGVTGNTNGTTKLRMHWEMSLLGELVRVYWERIFLYKLACSGTGLKWTDLIRRGCKSSHYNTSLKEKACFGLAKLDLPGLNIDLATPVYNFIREYGVPPLHHPLSVEEVINAVSIARNFTLANDVDGYMVRGLCEVISHHIESAQLPSREEAHTKISSQYAADWMKLYDAFAVKCNSEFVPRFQKM